MQDNRELSWCQLRRHRRHLRLSLWQPAMLPATTRPAPWQLTVLLWSISEKKGFTRVSSYRCHVIKHWFLWYKYCKLSRSRTPRYRVKSKGKKASSDQTVKPQKDTPYLTLTGELWGVFSDFWRMYATKYWEYTIYYNKPVMNTVININTKTVNPLI